MPAGHLVARLQAALHGQVDLDHLEHAGRQVVAGGDLVAFLVEAALELLALRTQPLGHLLELLVCLVVSQANLEPLFTIEFVEIALGDLAARLQAARPAVYQLV